MRALYLILPFLLVGCSNDPFNTKQDPLTGQPSRIRNATPPQEKKVEEHKAVSVDALVLEMIPGIANFAEGVENTVKFEGRVVGAELEHEITVENLPPGATFHAASGELTWTPPEFFINGMDFHDTVTIKAAIKTRTPSGAIISRPQDFVINVYRNFVAPEVLPVSGLATVLEGEKATFNVQVEDTDSVGADVAPNKTPRLVVIPSQNRAKDASAFVSMDPYGTNPVQDALNPNLWTFKMVLDLKGREITTSTKDMEFGLKVSSGFGVPSKEKFVPFSVLTNISTPVSTMEDESLKAIRGQLNTYYFNIYSPNGDGTIETAFNEYIASGFDVKCSSNSGKAYLQTCKLEWTPTVTGTRILKFKASNRHISIPDPATKTISNTFKVVAPTTPSAASSVE